VIHHCKNIIENHPEEFEDMITKINKKTFKIKIILVIDMIDPKIFKDNHAAGYHEYNIGNIEVKPLNSFYA